MTQNRTEELKNRVAIIERLEEVIDDYRSNREYYADKGLTYDDERLKIDMLTENAVNKLIDMIIDGKIKCE